MQERSIGQDHNYTLDVEKHGTIGGNKHLRLHSRAAWNICAAFDLNLERVSVMRVGLIEFTVMIQENISSS